MGMGGPAIGRPAAGMWLSGGADIGRIGGADIGRSGGADMGGGAIGGPDIGGDIG